MSLLSSISLDWTSSCRPASVRFISIVVDVLTGALLLARGLSLLAACAGADEEDLGIDEGG